VAIKYFLSGSDAFAKEFQTWRGLEHENLVKFYDVSLSPCCIFSEWIDGCNLKQYLSNLVGGASLELSGKIGSEVASALAYLHKNKIVHRDVKPENILLEQDEEKKVLRAVLTDFGVAGEYVKTVATSAKGTYIYMSPEALKGIVSPKSDIYALGICLWQLLSGKTSPLQGLLSPDKWELPVAILELVSDDKNRPTLYEEWPLQWRQLISSCWLTEHSDRPTADKVLQALTDFKN